MYIKKERSLKITFDFQAPSFLKFDFKHLDPYKQTTLLKKSSHY